jgi:class 3 adenylate cyclase
VSTIAEWLASLGMSEYSERFAEERIEVDVLSELTDRDLERLGISLGHRRRMLRAIRERGAAAPATPRAVALSPALQGSAERRQLTVVFCDLVGSTALSGELDPEDLRAVVGAYNRCCTELIERNGGFVAKYMGDAVLAYFGYPRAHEHDAERAVRAGLALVEAVPKLTTATVPLQVRVGIATGLVVVGDLIGAGAAQEQVVVGETPNLAARLQALAEPGAVVIASSTQMLTAGLFEYRDLGTVTLKGFAENVPAWQVLGAGATESRFEALHSTTTALVGREEEIDLLLRRWEHAQRGEGSVVLISGEPGIGKSRIAQAVVERLSAEPYTRLRFFCSPHHQDSALYPSIAQLERAASFRRDYTDEQRLDKLEAVLAQGTNDLGETVPLLAELLSIPTGDRYPPPNLTPQKRKEKTLWALLAQLERLATRQPVLMVFEDIHWIDPTSRDLLDMIVERVPVLPVLLIITFRTEFAPPWVGVPHVTLLSLSRLPPSQRREMISYVTGGKALPKEVADQVVDRTDGVPLFIEELTKAVVESRVLTDAGDRYTMAGPLPPLAIPTSLNASLLARLDRLASLREVAQIGAALGRQFSHELISAVAAMPQQKLDDALTQLVRAELIFRRGTAPEAEYTFKHALVQEAAYSTLLRSRRQQLHARIIKALESQFPEIVVAQPQVLAQHCAEANLDDKAVGYWLEAGQRAVQRAAMMEAEAQIRKGIGLLSSLPDSTKRKEQELGLQSFLARVLIATQGYAAPAVGETLGRAHQLWEQLGQPRSDVLLVTEVEYRLNRAELGLVWRKAQATLDLGESRDDPYWKLLGYDFSAAVSFWRGEFVTAREYAERSLTFQDEAVLPSPSYIGPVYGKSVPLSYVSRHGKNIALMYSFLSAFHLGYIDQAGVRCEEAIANARADPFHLALALSNALMIELEPTTLLRRSTEAKAHCTEHGFPQFAALATMYHGSALLALGRTEEGVAVLTERLGRIATGAVLGRPLRLTLLADSLGKAARPIEGLKRLDDAVRQVEATGERWSESNLHRVRGELLIAAGELAAAESSFREAITVACRQSAKFWKLCAATSLARLWRDQGKRAEAHDLLAPVYGWFTEGFDTPVLRNAKALLDELR